jgi:septal ring factor EnvC (AmiA/AmiB activator)
MTMENDPGLEQELRDTLGQQADVRLRLLELERDSLNRQLDRVNQRLDTVRTARDADVETELQKVLHKIDATRAAERRQKEAQRPAKAKNSAPNKKTPPAAESKSSP